MLARPLKPAIAMIEVGTCRPNRRVKWVFSALNSKIARELELEYRNLGCIVLSASSAHRLNDEIPLVAAQVNLNHLQLCRSQFSKYSGALVVKPNCVVTGLTLALKPLQMAFGISDVFVQSLQSISGAGYPGVAAWDLMDNLLPLPEEEEKVEVESTKVLGSLNENQIVRANIRISARCTRVPVLEGHLLAISVRFLDTPNREQIARAWEEYQLTDADLGEPQVKRALVFIDTPTRPQPRLDRNAGGGMTTTVGCLRKCRVMDWKFSALTHNTIQGAAGGLVRLAEYLIRHWSDIVD